MRVLKARGFGECPADIIPDMRPKSTISVQVLKSVTVATIGTPTNAMTLMGSRIG